MLSETARLRRTSVSSHAEIEESGGGISKKTGYEAQDRSREWPGI